MRFPSQVGKIECYNKTRLFLQAKYSYFLLFNYNTLKFGLH